MEDVNPAKLSHDVKPKMHKAHACLPWQGSTHVHPMIIIHTLWLFNIAMENGPFIDGLPIKNGDVPWIC